MQGPIIPGGYILLSRKLINSGIMLKPPDYLKVWIYLLSNASHSDIGNLKRGQGFTSIPNLIEILSYKVGYRTEKPTKKKVWGIIEWLRNPNEGDCEGNTIEPMIETTKVTHGFIYTICKYDIYQTPKNYESNNGGNDEEFTKEQRKERQGNNINKNYKNYNNMLLLSISKKQESEKKKMDFYMPGMETEIFPNFYQWVDQNGFTEKAVPPDDKAFYLKYLHEQANFYSKKLGKDHITTKSHMKTFEFAKGRYGKEVIEKAQSIS